MQKLKSIQALRGIAVITVVLLHLKLVERKYSPTNFLLPDWLDFGIFGVDLFFVISGFVMVTVTQEKFQSSKSSLLFLYHRVSRIYPLYWVYTTIALIVFKIQPSWVNSSQGNQANILSSYLLLPDNLLPLVQVGWTLIHEMYFYVVFFVIMLFLPGKYLPIALLLWGGTIAMFGPSTINPFYNLILHPLTIEFIAGCFIAMYFNYVQPFRLNGLLLIFFSFISILVAILSFVYFRSQTGYAPDNWDRVLYYGIPAALIVFFIVNAEKNSLSLPQFLIQVGNASYSIYLSHLFTINAIGKIWSIFNSSSIIDNFFIVPATIGMVLFIGFASYWYVEIPLLNLSRKLA